MRVKVSIALLIFIFSFSGSAFARRFGGGFSRGFSSRSFGGSRRSSGFFSSSGRRKSRPAGGGFFGTRKRKKGADSMLAKKTAQSGKRFSSRKEAMSNYKKNLKTKWTSKPKSRPKYVPKSVNRGGRNYNVVYNNGGYGFWNTAGTFMALSAANMMVTSAMLNRGGYMWGAPGYGGYGGYGHAPASGGSFFTGLIFFGLIIYIASRLKRGGGFS